MDQKEFEAMVAEVKHVVEKYTLADKYYFQIATHDGVNVWQNATSNLMPHDPIVYGKAFSISMEKLLVNKMTYFKAKTWIVTLSKP